MPAQVHGDDDVFSTLIVRMQFQLQTRPIQLIVQSTDGSHFCATLPYFSKGKELSSVVEAKLGIPHSQQLLMCQQKKVDSNVLLVEQNITTGSIILVQTQIKGVSGKCQWCYNGTF